MNKYIQQFLEDNDLQAGEKFYILNSNKEKLSDKTFYINKDFEKPEDILKCDGGTNSYPYTLLKLLVGNLLVKKISFYPQNGDTYYYVTALGEIEKVLFFDDANTLHCFLRKAGKCYRTRNEAEKHLIDDYKKLREM